MTSPKIDIGAVMAVYEEGKKECREPPTGS